MNFLKFIKDNKTFFIFDTSFLVFLYLIIICSPITGDIFNIFSYIFIINILFSSLYLLYLYNKRKKFLLLLYSSLENKNFNELSKLNKTYEESLYFNLFKSQNMIYEDTLKTFIDGYTENEELITLWIHDIKIPISIIKLIIDENMDLSFEPTLKDIDFQVKNIDDSLNKLLYLTRLDDFDKDFIISNVNVKKIIEKVISKHAKYFISKKLKLKLINLDYYILTDEKWLFFVIDQLISNSIKYVNYNGCILIRCHIENNNLILTIYDNGIGIKQEDLSRVFNKGFTGNNGRVNTKSTGLGLYLVKSLCDKVGYTIFIKSKINCYTAVSIGFPNFSDKEI